MLVLLVEYLFLTTLYGSYIFHGDLLWAAFVYCIYTCLFLTCVHYQVVFLVDLTFCKILFKEVISMGKGHHQF